MPQGFDMPLVRESGRQAFWRGALRGWGCPYMQETPRRIWQEGWDEAQATYLRLPPAEKAEAFRKFRKPLNTNSLIRD